jgi:8-oxo-dGTP pyrophosphatase MutT (NUDIX family)
MTLLGVPKSTVLPVGVDRRPPGQYEMGVVGGGPAHDGRRFVDPHGAEVPFDGASPITWRLSAYVLTVRDGRVLMVRQPAEWGGRWELPGGQVEADEALLQGAERECREETGYRFVASSSVPVHVQEAWFGGVVGYRHAVIFVFRGDVTGDADPASILEPDEIVQVAWMDPAELSAATTHSLHWPALQKAGLVFG